MNNRPMAFVFFAVFLGIIVKLLGAGLWLVLPALCSFFFPMQHFQKRNLLLTVLVLYSFLGLGMIRTAQVLAPLSTMETIYEEGQEATIQGILYKKEIKGETITYYVKQGEIQGQFVGAFLCYPETDTVAIGGAFQVTGTVAYFSGPRNEGGFDAKTYYHSQNLYFYLSSCWDVQTQSTGNRLKNFLYELQQQIAQVEMQYLPGEEGGLLAAITVGCRSGMDEDVKTLFANVGLSHIIAVSGLHVSVVGMGMYRFLRRKCTVLQGALVSGTILVLYGMLCGNSVSTLRAVGMFLLMLLSFVLQKDYDPLNALFLVGTILLLYNPMYLLNVSFQLSFVIVGMVIYVAGPMGDSYDVFCRLRWERTHKKVQGRRWTPSRKEKFVRGMIVTFFIQLSSIPVILWYFYSVPMYSLFLNVVLLPLIGVLLKTGLVAGILGTAIWVPSPVISLLFLPCHGILYFYEWLSAMVSKLPYCNVVLGRPSIVKILVYYAVLLVCCRFVVYCASLRKVGGMVREDLLGRSYLPMPKSMRHSILLSMVCLALLPVLCCISKRESFEVAMLDVGQGDGIYFQDGKGTHFFIDGGSTSSSSVGKNVILPFLKYRGIGSIDYWFVTHPDTDHMSGLLEVLASGYTVKHLVLSAYIVQNDNYALLLEAAEQYGVTIIYVSQGMYFVGDGFSMSPNSELEMQLQLRYVGSPRETEDANANSLVFSVSYRDFTGVFTGDIGEEEELEMLPLFQGLQHVTMLKVAHHGSNYSSSEAWCQWLSPEISLCSVGAKNSYGHPGAEAVSRLEATGTKLYYTKDSGEIRIWVVENSIFLKEMIR